MPRICDVYEYAKINSRVQRCRAPPHHLPGDTIELASSRRSFSMSTLNREAEALTGLTEDMARGPLTEHIWSPPINLQLTSRYIFNSIVHA